MLYAVPWLHGDYDKKKFRYGLAVELKSGYGPKTCLVHTLHYSVSAETERNLS